MLPDDAAPPNDSPGPSPIDASPQPPTTLPASGYFDLNVNWNPYPHFTNVTLKDTLGEMQSFCFDSTNKRTYVVQPKDGSSRGILSNPPGDLCVTELNSSGVVTGYMYLMGFGHGGSMGAEPEGTVTYLWTETASKQYDGGNGVGTKIARFPFVSGRTLTYGASNQPMKVFDSPDANAIKLGPSVDPGHNRLAVLYETNGYFNYAVYDLPSAAAAAGQLPTPFARPTQIALTSDYKNFQGYSVCGEYLYELFGKEQYPAGPYSWTATRRDLNTPAATIVETLTFHGNSNPYFEPEGMAIHLGPSMLCMGFVTKPSGTFKANIYCDNTLIPYP